jgi:signal transduction histidine kinase
MLTSRRAARLVVAAVFALTANFVVPVVAAPATARQKQVLVLFSTSRDAPIAKVVERELPGLLNESLPDGLDYYSEYVDSGRFSQRDYPAALHDFLRLKYAGHRFDVVLLVGDLIIDVVTKDRERLFPETPMVFYAPNQPTGRLANSTGLVNQLSFNRSLDLAIALQPDLKHVYVVSGASASDRVYETQARSQFAAFEQHLDLTYLSGLKTRDLAARLKMLPPQSAVFVVIVTKDGDGQNFQQMEYLARVASVANAPTYSWADIAVDAGIVGGHRRDQLAETRAIAALALRVISGERAEDISVSSPGTDVDQVDWRQLRRWGISEARVPAGTRVMFRELSTWDRYKGYIAGALALMLGQFGLITGLLVQRQRRRLAEEHVREREADLRRSYERIHHLGGRLLRAQEDERLRIARELHDDVGQQITLLALEIEHSRKNGRLRRNADADGAMNRLQQLARSVHNLSHRLHPPKLEIVGLTAALNGLARELSRPDFNVAFELQDVPPVLPPEVTLNFFRVAQEALQNAMKHSGADQVSMQLKGTPGGLVLTIADEGVGFDVDEVYRDGLGLASIGERVESIEGSLKVVSRPGAGTRLEITAPLPKPAAREEDSPSQQGTIAV